MNVSAVITKDNNLQGTKSLRCQEIESYSNSTKIIGAEEMHIIRESRDGEWAGDPAQWLHLPQSEKRDGVFSYLRQHNIILTLWDYHSQTFSKTVSRILCISDFS